MNVLIIVPIGTMSKRPRTYKLCNYLNRKGASIMHWGWDRNNDSEKERFGYPVAKKILLKGGGYSNSRNKAMYLFWLMIVFLRSFFIRKDTLVWAVGFESAFPVLLASKLRGFKVVFDDADRFSMVFSFPASVKRWLRTMEKFCSRNVDLHVIPNKQRYDFDSESFIEIKNMPADTDVEKARQIEPIRLAGSDKIIVYVNGLLEGMRGVDTLISVVGMLDQWNDRRVSFLVAGAVRGELAKQFIQLERVRYLGKLETAQALACYEVSDFVATYYSPKLEINRYAESNKWGDALKMGCAVIVNSEVKTSMFLKEIGCVYDFPYADAKGLASFLVNVRTSEVHEKAQRALQGAIKYPGFDALLDRCFEHLGFDFSSIVNNPV